MDVYVCIGLYRGLVDMVRVVEFRASAIDLETQWWNKLGITDAASREAKAGEGTEFRVVETELKR